MKANGYRSKSQPIINIPSIKENKQDNTWIRYYHKFSFNLLIIWVGRIAAIAADCKSAYFGIRWFESNPAHFKVK